MSEKISTPCQKICRLDATQSYCLACLRKIEEIKVWALLSEEKRLEIIKNLKQRKGKLSAKLQA